IAAPLHKVPKSSLASEDARQARRARALAWFGISLLCALTVTATFFGWNASVERSKAEKSEARAKDEKRTADLQTAEANWMAAEVLRTDAEFRRDVSAIRAA